MTRRHTGPDRYRTTPAHCAAVLLGMLLTITVVIGTAAGPHAGLVAAGLLIGLPCAATAVLVLLGLAADRARTARHRRAWRRAGFEMVDVGDIDDQAHTDLTRRLDPGGCTSACANTPGIRGLLEHVGHDITVDGTVVDSWTTRRPDQEA